ncbi:MAG: transcription elongation factor GreA [Clostridia bacterium]|nr:transcription elongation factor GreA [Clostridia bacterium]
MATILKYTQEGFEKLKAEYEFRTKEERERIKVAIAEARSFGDLSENAEYDEARNEQAKNEARIKELDDMIQHAVVIDDSQMDAEIVGLGSSVKVERNGVTVEYKIVGSNEADPFDNKISDMSPVGRALIGAKKGDVVSLDVPSGSVNLKVLDVYKA